MKLNSRAPLDEIVGPLGQRVIQDRDRHRHFEAVVVVQLENRVGAVLVHRVEAEQLGGPLAIQRNSEPTMIAAPAGSGSRAVATVQPLEVARERRGPRQQRCASVIGCACCPKL